MDRSTLVDPCTFGRVPMEPLASRLGEILGPSRRYLLCQVHSQSCSSIMYIWGPSCQYCSYNINFDLSIMTHLSAVCCNAHCVCSRDTQSTHWDCPRGMRQQQQLKELQSFVQAEREKLKVLSNGFGLL